jgi:hypothetical protein
MLIKVKQEHIKEGCRQGFLGCPIALAALEQIGKPVGVLYQECKVYTDDTYAKWQVIKLPIEACIFIGNFDAGMTVEPFEFELDYEVQSNS